MILTISLPDYFYLAITFIYIVDCLVRFYGLGFTSFTANWWNAYDFFVSFGSFGTTLAVTFGEANFELDQVHKVFLVAIAFKLVQRNDSLNVLFKTAMYVVSLHAVRSVCVNDFHRLNSASLPTISSLLALWLVMFIFFGILYVEVFGMTKWDSGENHNQNYYSMGSALVMLTFMSVGYGFLLWLLDVV